MPLVSNIANLKPSPLLCMREMLYVLLMSGTDLRISKADALKIEIACLIMVLWPQKPTGCQHHSLFMMGSAAQSLLPLYWPFVATQSIRELLI